MTMGNKDDDFEELLKPKIHPDIIRKEIKINEYNGQYSVKLPKMIIDEMGLKKNSLMIIEFNTNTKECSIKMEKKKK